MARTITVIPSRANRTDFEDNIEQNRKKMAAYCRVSTDSLEQQSSYDAQVNFYSTYISGHPDYEFAGIYADEGITGTNTKKREQFNRMIDDCVLGKIDMVITKSISRYWIIRNLIGFITNFVYLSCTFIHLKILFPLIALFPLMVTILYL